MSDVIYNISSGFYDSVNGDRLYSAADMNKPYKRVIADGIFPTPQGTPSTDFQVVAVSGMSVAVLAGNAMIGARWAESADDVGITIAGNSSSSPRIDSIFLHIDTGMETRAAGVVYRQGTAGASPTAPAIVKTDNITELRLADILVAPSAAIITQANITDQRGGSECPWVAGLIQQVDTSALFDQYRAAYAEQQQDQADEWKTFMDHLARDYDISMSLRKHESTYTSTAAASIIPINIDGYDTTKDLLQVFINGIFAVEGTHYIVKSAAQIQLTNAISAGQKVHFVIYKAVMGGAQPIIPTDEQVQDAVDAYMDAHPGALVVDPELSDTSTHAIQNKAVTEAFAGVNGRLDYQERITDAGGETVVADTQGFEPGLFNAAVGSQIAFTSDTWFTHCHVDNVQEYDKFLLTVRVSNGTQIYAVGTDADDIVKYVWPGMGTAGTYTDKEIMIPAGVTKLYVGAQTSVTAQGHFLRVKQYIPNSFATESFINGVAADVSNGLEEIGDRLEGKVRIQYGNLEVGNYALTDGALSKTDSTAWVRTKEPFKVPAFSQFIITSPAIRGYVYTSTDGETWTQYNWITATSKKHMPLEDVYVVFKFSYSEGYNTPTIDDVFNGFYIQYAYDTKDYSDLVSFDSRLRPIERVNPHGRFVVGTMANGIPNVQSLNRIVFVDAVTFDTDITVRIADGFRCGFHTYADGTWTASDWKRGTYAIAAGTVFKIIISRVTEQEETADKWWMDFVRAITFEATVKAEAVPNISMNKPFMLNTRTKFALHRGLQSQAPENSVPAFRLAGQAGAWGIETDVYETTDGRFVCIHDSTVDRTTDGTGDVRSFSFAEIEALTIDEGTNIDQYPNLKIPTFEEYLAICKTYGCVAFIEIKGVDNLQLLFDTVVKYGMLYQSVFTVWKSLMDSMRAIDTDAIVPCLINGYQSSASYMDIIDSVKTYPNVMVGLQTGPLMTDEVIEAAHANNITVCVWTVNNVTDSISWFERGVDLITTNSLTDLSD